MLSKVSYNVVIERFKAFADGHYLIRRFSHGQVDVTDIVKDNEYPWMHVVPVSMTPSDGSMAYEFDVIFADLPRDKETPTEYQREALSDCVRLAEDLIAEIKNGGVIFGLDVTLDTGTTIEPFIEEYTHTLTGVNCKLSMTFPNNWSACDIPADWSAGGSGSGGSGGGGVSLILRTNGTDNAIQTILDLTAGANMTITDLGDGRVQFDATGDIGTTWGTIGGLLADQTDLQNALDLKADIASLAAVAFSGDYNDLLNLPADPSLQDVTDVGNTTTNDIQFGAGAGIVFNNGARVEEGTTNGGLGGVNGVALKCSIDYEFKWEAGRLYVMEQNGFTIREVSHTFNDTPSVNDDDTLGYVIGSRWILDNGSIYTCSDATTGAAVWLLESKGSVTSVGLSVPSPANAAFNVSNSPITNSGTIAITANGTIMQYIDGTGALQSFPAIPKTLGDLIVGTNKGDLIQWTGTKWDIIHGLDLDGLNDVTISSASNGQILQYNGTSWVNVTPASGGSVTSVGLSMPAPINPAFSVSGSPVTTSGTLAVSANGTSSQYVDGTGALQSFPALSGFVPYVGATQDVDLDTFKISTKSVYITGTAGNGHLHMKHQSADATATGQSTAVWADSNGDIKWKNDGQYKTTLKTSLNTADRVYTFPDENCTLVPTSRSISTTSPLSGGGDLSVNRTLSIADAVADGATKGAAAFTASDFNSASGVISLDYANGQKASASQAGFLSAADWSTFNSKPSGDSIAFASNPNTSQAAGSTTYWSLTGSAAPNATENARVIVMPCAGTLKNLYIRIGALQSSGGTCVFTLRKNAADTAISVTFANSDGSNVTKSDTTNSVSVAAGDVIALKGVNNAPSSASGTFVSFTILLERT